MERFQICTYEMSNSETAVAADCVVNLPLPSSSAEFLFWKIVAIHIYIYLLFANQQAIDTVIPLANLFIDFLERN